MLISILLAFLPLSYTTNITAKENCDLKIHCGYHFLTRPAALKLKLGVNIRKEAKAKPNEYPWVVALYRHGGKSAVQEITGTPPSDTVTACTGVQISNRHVLTSARCVVTNSSHLEEHCRKEPMKPNPSTYSVQDPKQFTIFVGSQCTNPEKCWSNRAQYTIGEIKVNENYNPCNLSGDLAILEVSTPILPTHGSPVCMPNAKSLLGAKLTAIGFGVDTLSGKEVSGKLSDLRSVVLTKTSEHPDLLTMASYSKSICAGDTGGPLVRNANQADYSLRGIALTADPPCDQGPPNAYRTSFFTDVRKYLNWICKNTGICSITDYAAECERPRLIIYPQKEPHSKL